MPRLFVSSTAKGHRHTFDLVSSGHHRTSVAAGHAHDVHITADQMSDIRRGEKVDVVAAHHIDHDHVFSFKVNRLANGPLGRRHEKYGPKKMAANWALHTSSSHPYSLLGKTTDDQDVFINNLDAMGLAFQERTFRSRPDAHAYSVTNRVTGHTTDWLFDDDTEAWVREGSSRAQLEAASSDPENRLNNPAAQRWRVLWQDPDKNGAWTVYQSDLSRTRAEKLAHRVKWDLSPQWFPQLGFNVETRAEQEPPAELDRLGNPTRYSFESDLSALSRDAFDNGLSNSDASLDDAHEAFSHHHDRTFVEEQVEHARQNVDVDADVGDFLLRRDDGTPRSSGEVEQMRSAYRSAFGSGFRQRLERALPRWIAEETREQNPAARFKRGVFRLERGPSYGGLTLGETWNGFEVPYFDLAIAEKVVRDNGGRTRLEGSTLRYVLPDDAAFSREPSTWTAEKPVLVKGVAYYSFQGWSFFRALQNVHYGADERRSDLFKYSTPKRRVSGESRANPSIRLQLMHSKPRTVPVTWS